MWTDENVAFLTKMAQEGLSYGEIAALLGNGFTRSSVIGKANRLKLPPRIGGIRERAFRNRMELEGRRAARRAKKVAAQAREAVKRAQKALKPIPGLDTSVEALIALPINNFINQKKGYCKFPHGPDCHERALDSQPYCAMHHARSRV